jgi:deoxyribodipyrimidine photo-lyase
MPARNNILVWFRADLRVADNTALHRASLDAAALGGATIGVFFICPDQWRRHAMAGIRADFILRHLHELSIELAKLNIPLLIQTVPKFARIASPLTALAAKHSCRAIYWNKEYEINEVRRDAAVAEACAHAGFQAHSFTDQVLAEPGDIRTGAGNFYTVFTPFKRSLYKHLEVHGPTPPLPRPRKQTRSPVHSSPIPAIKGFSPHVPDASTLWPAGEKNAMKRLEAFVDDYLQSYQSDRNVPGLDATSTLSPYLAVGAISVRQCLAAALAQNGGRLDGPRPGPTTWISELAWRDFYRHVMIGFPRVCMGRAFKPETERIKWNRNDSHFRAWCEGRTGVPIVDAGMRQLAATGWVHNRVRMIVAMFLTKDLFIDWRAGERFFMEHLIDGDLGSNNGGWQWSASTGTDAAPYFRIFNPFSQSRTCDPSGDYIRRWVPELRALSGGPKGPIHDPSVLPAPAHAKLHYPKPIVDHAKTRDRVMKAFRGL